MAMGFVVAGCFAGFPDHDPRGDLSIVAKIEAADSVLIASVDYVEGDYMDPATILVEMAPDTDDADVRAVMCEIVIPARIAIQGSEGLSIVVVDDAREVTESDWDFRCGHPSTPSPAAAPAS